jgi:hypothetical protein
MKSIFSAFLFAFLIITPVSDGVAQSRKGFEVGIGPGFLMALDHADGDATTSFGAHFTAAYGFGERFTVGLNAAVTRDSAPDSDGGSAVLSVGGIFGRLYFGGPEKLTKPYFTFGGGQASYEMDFLGFNLDVTGPSGMLGLGIDRMLAGSRLGFYGEVNYNIISFDEAKIGGIDIGEIEVDMDYIVIAAGVRFRIR